MQILYHKSTYVTPNAGRPQAFRQAGAGKEKRHENPISQIARFGGDMKLRFSRILKKNTGVCIPVHMCLKCVCVCACVCLVAERAIKQAVLEGFPITLMITKVCVYLCTCACRVCVSCVHVLCVGCACICNLVAEHAITQAVLEDSPFHDHKHVCICVCLCMYLCLSVCVVVSICMRPCFCVCMCAG